jgi:hypothetical protein
MKLNTNTPLHALGLERVGKLEKFWTSTALTSENKKEDKCNFYHPFSPLVFLKF